jgi:hypothetical protein
VHVGQNMNIMKTTANKSTFISRHNANRKYNTHIGKGNYAVPPKCGRVKLFRKESVGDFDSNKIK